MQAVFAARRNTDQTEGRGVQEIVGLFRNKADAQNSLVGDWIGKEVQELWMYDSLEEFRMEKKAKIRQQALSKLSAEEREALGVR